MPRLVTCHHCKILQRMPDVAKGTPMRVARLQWETGEDYVYKDTDGHPLMVPAYDPVLEDFVLKHSHGYSEAQVISGLIQSWQIDQATWDAMDVVTKIKDQIHDQMGEWYEERDEYREAAAACYNAHGNPDITTGCRDYLDDSKRFGPAKYQTEDGEITVPPKFRQYLCYLCPYQQAYINVELRRRKGVYN